MTDYFSHDVDASDDIKLQELQMEMGGNGYGIFWRLLELLWKNGGKMAYKPALLAYNLRWATADDIDKVVNNYGLFVVQDGQFWSASQLARLQQKKEISDARASAARQGAEGRRAQRQAAEQTPDEAPNEQMPSTCSANAEQMPSNKLINKLINKSLSDACAGAPAHEREERERIFVKFFFKNFKNPAQEVARYYANYAGLGWKTSKGAAIKDRITYADNWKPQEDGHNFRDAAALRWWREIYDFALAQGWEYADAIPLALTDIARDTRDPNNIIVVFNDKEAGALVKQYIKENNLAVGKWSGIAYQLGTKRITQ